MGIGSLFRKRAPAQDELTSEEFADEEVLYPGGYWPKTADWEVEQFQKLFPLYFGNEHLLSQALPMHAEGLSAVPRWELFDSTYKGAVEKVADQLYWRHNKCRFDDQFDFDRLKQTERTADAFALIGRQQFSSEILLVPTQFGRRHRGRSARRSGAILAQNEFGLGTFASIMLLMIYPERLKGEDDFGILCLGDEYDADSKEGFAHVPILRCYDDELNREIYLSQVKPSYASDLAGSATGFLW